MSNTVSSIASSTFNVHTASLCKIQRLFIDLPAVFKDNKIIKQVAQWATIAHLGASIMFGDTIIDEAQGQVTLN